MKRLVVVRHAKSSWSNPDLTDSQRPLNKRGNLNAPEMGRRLKVKGISVDLIISSKANRALSTARYIASEIGYDTESIQISSQLYHTINSQMLQLIQSLSDDISSVMIFGHNPGFTDFTNYLCNSDIYNIPTAGVAVIDFNILKWGDIVGGIGQLSDYDYPKKDT